MKGAEIQLPRDELSSSSSSFYLFFVMVTTNISNTCYKRGLLSYHLYHGIQTLYSLLEEKAFYENEK